MNAISELFAQPIFQAIGAALLHFLWQGALVTLLVASLSVLLQKRNARTRYAVACAGMVLMLALPALTVAIVYDALPAVPAVRGPATTIATAPRYAGGAADLPKVSFGGAPRTGEGGGWPILMPWLVAIWIGGVFVFSLRAAGGWLLVNRLRKRSNIPAPEHWQETLLRLAQKLRVKRAVQLCESAIAEVPAVIGWLRPVILVPVGALSGLSAVQVEAVLAHELAHIRRHDYLVNLLQTVVENLLFYHPGVWWVSRRIRIEREHCCDDLAVAACGDAVLYARALTALEGLRSEAGPQLAMAADGGSLLGRVRRLLGVAAGPSRSTLWAASMIFMVSLCAIGVGAHHALLPVVKAQASAISTRVSALITPRKADERAAAASTQAPPHLLAEVTVPIPADENFPDAESNADPTVAADAESAGDPADPQQGSYIDEMAAAGYPNLTVDQLVAMRSQGVTPDYIRELSAAGYDHLEVNKLVAFRIHGITGDYARAMNAAGFGRLDENKLVAAKIHGATPQYLDQMRAVVKDADFNQLVAFRIHGVTPEFIKEFAGFGFDEPSAEQLLAARIHGIDADFVKEMQGLGLGKLGWNKIVALRIHGVTPAFVKKVRDRGFTDLNVDQILQLKMMGIIKDN
jgi:beta-lactamase regulating signal transducer with metallopeptidase domain